jgi:hypothetical protein
MSKSKNQDYKDYHSELKQIWLEYGHERDLDPQNTTADFDISHQRGWRDEK